MFIAEMAARDPHRPGYTVERASKILASSTWSGSGYQSLYQTPAEVRDALTKAGIGLVVTDTSLPAPPAHDLLLAKTLAEGRFSTLSTSTAVRDGRKSPGAIELHSIAVTPK